ncbi:MAG: histidine kinase [Actinomycetota bacterium]
MSDRAARRWAWAAFGVWVACIVAAFALSLFKRPLPPGQGAGNDVTFLSITAAFPIVGILILARQPRNRIGWILMAIGIGWVLPFGEIGEFLISRNLLGGPVFVALSGPTWAPPIGLMGTSLLLRFPNGELLSPRWRKVEWIAAVAISVTVLAILFDPRNLGEVGFPNLPNPLGIEAIKPLLDVVIALIILIPLTIIASAFSLVRRFRRSSGIERLQLKWLTSAAAVVAVVYLLAMIASINYTWESTIASQNPAVVTFIQNLAVFSFVLIPIAIGFAVLKYRLYDIDVVINKTLVYGAMAAFITAVYVAIVVGLGRAVGSERNLALSILATALVAVGFQPVRERVQRWANRLVYGKRATPYEVLSEFSGGMSHAVATEELLPEMARMVARGTGAARADIWLHLGGQFVLEASWHSSVGEGPPPGRTVRTEDAIRDEADAAVPVRHQGQLLGVIAVTKGRGEAVRPGDLKLLEDLASQAGLVVRNVRLIEDLRTSRQRLVTAQDEERRRLERDLHDGAQQRLVSIALALRMARNHIDPDTEPELAARVDQAAEQMALALSELREFARGIHPAILTERGLVPALESLAERSPVAASVVASVDRRLPATVEATAYFVVSEALANVGKYSKASRVTIEAKTEDRYLLVEVADDGVGGADPSRGSGLRGLADRVAVVDGRLEIDSPPGEGTRLRCTIPLPGQAEDLATANLEAMPVSVTTS